MFTNLTLKKKIIYIIIAVVLIIAVATGSVLVFRAINGSSKDETISISDKPAADKLKAKAIEALSTNKNQAKALFQTALRQYEYIYEKNTDTAIRDAAKVDMIDCEAQLFLLEHS